MVMKKDTKHTINEEKSSILQLYPARKLFKNIDKQLNRDLSSIRKFIKSWKQEDDTCELPIWEEKRGRKQKLSENDEETLTLLFKRYYFVTTNKLETESNLLEHVSRWTISRTIKESGEFNSYWVSVKPFISNRDRNEDWNFVGSTWNGHLINGTKFYGRLSLFLYYAIKVRYEFGDTIASGMLQIEDKFLSNVTTRRLWSRVVLQRMGSVFYTW